MEERRLKLINDSIRAIRDFCDELDIDCTEQDCPFKNNCPMHTSEPPSNWTFIKNVKEIE